MQGETVRSPISIAPGRCDHQSHRAIHKAPGRCGHQSHRATKNKKCLHFSICATKCLHFSICATKRRKILITVAQIASDSISFRGVSRAIGMMVSFGDAHFSQLTFLPTVTSLHPQKTTSPEPPRISTSIMPVVNKEANLCTTLTKCHSDRDRR